MAYAKIRPKRGTKSQWEQANTVLAEGELGIEVPNAGIGKGQVKVKQGDGSTPWKNLPYALDLTDFVNHLEDTENPHEVSPEQIGAATPEDVNAAVKKAAPKNLLDNSDFRNPVNQRGKTSYNSRGYCIDRWYTGAWNSDYPTVTVESGGIRIAGGASGANSCELKQKIEAKGLCGKTVTAVVKYKSFTVTNEMANSLTVADATHAISAKVAESTNNLLLLTFVVSEGTEILEFYIGNSASYGGNGTFDAVLEWAALYDGEYTAETLPEYQPKGYGAELAECQRYFLQYNFSDVILPAKMYSGGGSADVSFFLPCTMRLTKPTVSVTATHCQLFADNSNTDCNITEAYLSTGNFVGLTAVAESNLTGSAVAVCRIIGELTLSADL